MNTIGQASRGISLYTDFLREVHRERSQILLVAFNSYVAEHFTHPTLVRHLIVESALAGGGVTLDHLEKGGAMTP